MTQQVFPGGLNVRDGEVLEALRRHHHRDGRRGR
jgi:hypothetical protein